MQCVFFLLFSFHNFIIFIVTLLNCHYSLAHIWPVSIRKFDTHPFLRNTISNSQRPVYRTSVKFKLLSKLIACYNFFASATRLLLRSQSQIFIYLYIFYISITAHFLFSSTPIKRDANLFLYIQSYFYNYVHFGIKLTNYIRKQYRF